MELRDDSNRTIGAIARNGNSQQSAPPCLSSTGLIGVRFKHPVSQRIRHKAVAPGFHALQNMGVMVDNQSGAGIDQLATQPHSPRSREIDKFDIRMDYDHDKITGWFKFLNRLQQASPMQGGRPRLPAVRIGVGKPGSPEKPDLPALTVGNDWTIGMCFVRASPKVIDPDTLEKAAGETDALRTGVENMVVGEGQNPYRRSFETSSDFCGDRKHTVLITARGPIRPDRAFQVADNKVAAIQYLLDAGKHAAGVATRQIFEHGIAESDIADKTQCY